MVPGMTGQFYDKVTRKFGTFQGVPRPLTTYPQGNPEEMFEQKLYFFSEPATAAVTPSTMYILPVT
jgi:hypothetical protein